MLGKILIEGDDEAALDWLDPNKLNLVAEVSTKVRLPYRTLPVPVKDKKARQFYCKQHSFCKHTVNGIKRGNQQKK
jgi:hypothetical protein